MKQKYELGQVVYVFRIIKGETQKAVGIVKLAELNKSGYIQYSVDVAYKSGNETKRETWQTNHASMATNEVDIERKRKTYVDFNQQQHEKYIELFGAPDFNIEEIEKQLGV